MNGTISRQARLLRGFAVDFLTCHDVGQVPAIMDPDYRLTIGGHVFDGRDQHYLPATAAQLDQFPGLCVTVHDVVLGSDHVAMRFTEHGASIRHGGRAAAWGGVTLFRIDGGRLREGWAEEDYFARKRQLATGRCDRVPAPCGTPWDMPVEPPDLETEHVARGWLADTQAIARHENVEQICSEGPSLAELIGIDEITIDVLFTAGRRAGFRMLTRGRYLGGFLDLDRSLTGTPISLSVAGLLSIRDGGRVDAQIAFDRLGLHRFLQGGKS